MRVIWPSINVIRSSEWKVAQGALADDLERAAATINDTWSVDHNPDGSQTVPSVGDSPWINIRFNAAFYTANSTGSITVAGGNPYCYRYVNRVNTIELQLANKVTINNGTTTEFRVALPQGFKPMPYDQVSGTDENQVANAGFFNDGTNAGVCGVFINVSGKFISFQRWDGTPSAGFLNGSTTFVRGCISVPGTF